MKKHLYTLFVSSLALGAGLIVGLLSFSGFYVVCPNLYLDTLGFVLSFVYEGEIYLQNIQGALDDLFMPLDQKLANHFLNQHFKDHQTLAFFEEYGNYVRYQHTISLDNPNYLKVEKKLLELEQKFLTALFEQENDDSSTYGLTTELKQTYLNRLASLRIPNILIHLFSAFTAFLMSVGTSYLLLEALASLSFITIAPWLLPFIIVPMAILAGSAYGLLTLNTFKQMLIYQRIPQYISQLQEDYQQHGITLKIITALGLAGLSIMLTICTAGTWLSIIKGTAPLFQWMTRLSPWILGTTIPTATGIAALGFNLENSCETLETLEEIAEHDWRTELYTYFIQIKSAWLKESWLRRLNPFRALHITLLVTLATILFLGHIISMSATGDRVPGLPILISIILGIISEFFEDLHYFIPKQHQHDTSVLVHERLSAHGHDHSDNLPLRFLKFILSPLEWGSRSWIQLSESLEGPSTKTDHTPNTPNSNDFKTADSTDSNDSTTVFTCQDNLCTCEAPGLPVPLSPSLLPSNTLNFFCQEIKQPRTKRNKKSKDKATRLSIVEPVDSKLEPIDSETPSEHSNASWLAI